MFPQEPCFFLGVKSGKHYLWLAATNVGCKTNGISFLGLWFKDLICADSCQICPDLKPRLKDWLISSVARSVSSRHWQARYYTAYSVTSLLLSSLFNFLCVFCWIPVAFSCLNIRLICSVILSLSCFMQAFTVISIFRVTGTEGVKCFQGAARETPARKRRISKDGDHHTGITCS